MELTPEMREAIRADYQAGKKWHEIAADHRVSIHMIGQATKDMPRRTPARAERADKGTGVTGKKRLLGKIRAAYKEGQTWKQIMEMHGASRAIIDEAIATLPKKYRRRPDQGARVRHVDAPTVQAAAPVDAPINITSAARAALNSSVNGQANGYVPKSKATREQLERDLFDAAELLADAVRELHGDGIAAVTVSIDKATGQINSVGVNYGSFFAINYSRTDGD